MSNDSEKASGGTLAGQAEHRDGYGASIAPMPREHVRVKNFRAARMLLYPNNAEGRTTMSVFKRALYCAPRAGILPVITLLLIYSASFYERLGTNLQIITFSIALARCMDILADPVVSHLSDTFRGAFGRRRPFFFAGCWLYVMLLLFVVFWVGSFLVALLFSVFPGFARGPGTEKL